MFHKFQVSASFHRCSAFFWSAGARQVHVRVSPAVARLAQTGVEIHLQHGKVVNALTKIPCGMGYAQHAIISDSPTTEPTQNIRSCLARKSSRENTLCRIEVVCCNRYVAGAPFMPMG